MMILKKNNVNRKNYLIVHKDNFPFVTIKSVNDTSILSLKNWILSDQPYIHQKITSVGGVFLTGFDVNSAQDFQEIAKAIEPNLCTTHDFDGSARMWLTENIYTTFSLSILQDSLPVDFHNEDGFMPYTPSLVMFCSLKPADQGGGSIFSDCRKVYDALPSSLKQRFMGRKIKNLVTFDDDIFLVNSRLPKNKKKIINLAKKYGATDVYRLGDFKTRFTFETPAVINHEITKSCLWYGRAHQADLVTNIVDIWYAYQYQSTPFRTLKSLYLGGKLSLKYIINSLQSLWIPESLRITYSFDNGKKTSLFDQIRIRKAQWDHSLVLPLKKGDVVVIDNRLLTHGRLPYKGQRNLLSSIGPQIMVEPYQSTLTLKNDANTRRQS